MRRVMGGLGIVLVGILAWFFVIGLELEEPDPIQTLVLGLAYPGLTISVSFCA
jgi:hypothetical protein